jgi:hypothetical protein
MRYILFGLLIILAAIVGPFFFQVFYRWIRYGYGYGFHKTQKEQEEDNRRVEEWKQAYQQRLQNPNFEELEKLWGHSFPASLKAFYQDKETIVQEDFKVVLKTLVDDELTIEGFEPADAKNEPSQPLGDFTFALGYGKGGEPYSYDIDPRLDDPEVVALSENNMRYPLGVNLSAFLASLRKKHSDSTGLKE